MVSFAGRERAASATGRARPAGHYHRPALGGKRDPTSKAQLKFAALLR
jgi:hypothetical protein